MLKRAAPMIDEKGACVRMAEASFPSPFHSGLEFGAPARGVWNIVHTGMLIPEAHEIYVCASSCLRGVVLTAAEMGAQGRFSTVTIKENNVLDGDMEELIIEGVTGILARLPYRPRAVLLYTSCIHHFMGCDLAMCFDELRRRHPDIDFTDCYMNPIMRKSGLTPDQLMRRQLYSLLKPKPTEERSVNIIGNDLPTDETSDLVRLIRRAGWRLRDITQCTSYDEYQDMAKSALNVCFYPPARAGCEALSERLGQKMLYIPASFGAQEIKGCMSELAAALGADYDGERDEEAALALKRARDTVGSMPIAIDYTAVGAPFSLARLLLENGFRVCRIYCDGASEAERGDFEWIRKNAPDVRLYATIHVKMRVLPRETDEKMLAIGQKAAYFTGARNFVNIVEGGGMYGFDGIRRLASLMEEASLTERDAADYIQQKGLGCTCCL